MDESSNVKLHLHRRGYRDGDNQDGACIIRDVLSPEMLGRWRTELLGYTFGNYSLGFYSNPRSNSGVSDIVPPEIALGFWPRDLPDMIKMD